MSRRRRTASSAPPARQLAALLVFAVLAFVAPVRTAVFDGAASIGQKIGEHEGRALQKTADDVARQGRERASSQAPVAPASR